MSLSITERDHVTVVTPKGAFFGSLRGQTFRDALATLRAEGKHHLVVDLGQTTTMDSSGIGILIAEAQAFRAAGGDLHLACVEARVRNLFVMTRLLGEVFTLYPTVDEAAQSFAAEPVTA